MTHFDLRTVINNSRVSNGQMEMNSLGHKSLAERAANDKKSSASAFPLESKKSFKGLYFLLSFFFKGQRRRKLPSKSLANCFQIGENLWQYPHQWAQNSTNHIFSGSQILTVKLELTSSITGSSALQSEISSAAFTLESRTTKKLSGR